MHKLTDSDVTRALDFALSCHGGDSGGHGADHIERVMANARKIMRCEGVDVDENLVLFCCALHDVDDKKLICGGTRRTERFFDDMGYDDDIRRRVREITDAVSYSDNPEKNDALSYEAKIVQDADRLDALGAVGIARAFAYGGKAGRPMFISGGGNSSEEHFYKKLFRLPGLMNTKTGRTEGESRAEFMRKYLDELHSEQH